MRARAAIAAVIFSLLVPLAAGAAQAPAPVPAKPDLAAEARSLLAVKDYLGFRVFLKKSWYRAMSYKEWFSIRGLVNAYGEEVGFDMIHLWNARNPQGKSNLDKTLEYADGLMLAGKFDAAFNEYQKMATYIRKSKVLLAQHKGAASRERYEDISALYPFVIHSMGRALYGAGRFEEALVVYSWIPSSYGRFRQVLFEKMWAAFRAGKVELALGAVASQRSAFYARRTSPETYLIQTYIYRKLCRTEDLNQVVAEMKRYSASLERGGPEKNGAELADWASSDLESRALLTLSRTEPRPIKGSSVTVDEKEKERKEIQAMLERAFQHVRPKLLADLKTVMAYAYVAGSADSSAILKPIEKLTSRQALLASDREIWPADSAEEWVDEIGTHYFVGESLCGVKNPS